MMIRCFAKLQIFFYFYIYPPTLLLYVATDSIQFVECNKIAIKIVKVFTTGIIVAQTTTKKIIVLATRATNNNTNNKADFYKADVAVHTYVYVCVMKSFSRLRLRMRVVASLHITVIYIFSYSCCCIFHCKHIYTHISIYRCNIFVYMYYILATSNMLHKDAALVSLCQQ